MNITTQEKIDEIKSKLQGAEDTDFAYMSTPVKELRHYVLYVHSSLERSLEIRIGRHIVAHLNPTKEEKQKVYWNMKDVLEEIDYAKKIKIAQKQGVIPSEMVSKLFAVNNIRVPFAHPSSYQEKLREYRDEAKELEAYEILNAAYHAMDNLWLDEQKKGI